MRAGDAPPPKLPEPKGDADADQKAADDYQESTNCLQGKQKGPGMKRGLGERSYWRQSEMLGIASLK